MGLEVVVQEIRAEGAKEERTLLAQAETERSRILEQARSEADELTKRRRNETRLKVEALRREIQSASEFEARRRGLIVRRELAEGFRQRVLKAIASLPKVENEALLSELVKQAKQTIPKGVVHARTSDLPLLTKAGYERGRELSGAGGFQVESTDGTVLVDHRYETLLENAWKEILNATQELFEGK